MIRTILITCLGLLILSPCVTASGIDSLDQKAQGVLENIHQWNARELKTLLTVRIQDNQSLLELIHANGTQLGETEIDAEYTQFLENLMEDQKALLSVTDHLSSIDKDNRLNLGAYLANNPSLKRKITHILSRDLRSQSSNMVVNQVLYHTLMEKYAIR